MILLSSCAREGIALKQRCGSRRRSTMLKGHLSTDGLFYAQAATCGNRGYVNAEATRRSVSVMAMDCSR
jgi:hypothetical protein